MYIRIIAMFFSHFRRQWQATIRQLRQMQSRADESQFLETLRRLFGEEEHQDLPPSRMPARRVSMVRLNYCMAVTAEILLFAFKESPLICTLSHWRKPK